MICHSVNIIQMSIRCRTIGKPQDAGAGELRNDINRSGYSTRFRWDLPPRQIGSGCEAEDIPIISLAFSIRSALETNSSYHSGLDDNNRYVHEMEFLGIT
jgi:hypothetical protein